MMNTFEQAQHDILRQKHILIISPDEENGLPEKQEKAVNSSNHKTAQQIVNSNLSVITLSKMKNLLWLIFLPFLLSCSKGSLVDGSKSETYYYSTSKKKIWYKASSAPDISKLWDYEWREVPADAKTFTVLEKGYGKDKNHIFSGDRIVDYVDYATFTINKDGIIKDKNHVYLSLGEQKKIIENANPATYQKVILGGKEHNEYDQYWAKDNQHYFYQDSIARVDYNSFTFLTPNISADKDFIYSQNYLALLKYPNKNASSKGFSVLDDNIVYTLHYFYYRDFFSKDEITEIPVKDARTIKMYCYQDYFSIDNVVYFQAQKIENADATTFETFEKGNAVRFAKDKNNVFAGKEIIPNVKPADVKYNATENNLEYKGKLWNWKTKAFDEKRQN